MNPTAAGLRQATRVRLLRRARLALVVLLVLWFFSPPSIRDAVPLWLPFAVALALEVQFVVANYRNTAPFFRRDDRRPGAADRERYGDGGVADWAIVQDQGGPVWVDLSEPETSADATPAKPAARPQSRVRRLLRPLAEAAVVLAAVAALVLLLDRGSWESLDTTQQRAAEARFSAAASLVAGKTVRIGCDTSGRLVGGVQHADGVAIVGGDRAFLTPDLCYALYRLAFDGEVRSFSETARAVAVLSHEAWHLRGERDEGRTECFGLQSGVTVGRRVGLDEDTARRMMRSQLVADQLYRRTAPEYLLPRGCSNRGRYDLQPEVDRFP